MKERLTLASVSTPKLPTSYRPISVGRTILWVWAITSTVVLIVLTGFITVAFSILNDTSTSIGNFIEGAGCSAYWDFILDAKKSGIELEVVQKLVENHASPKTADSLSSCGSIAVIYRDFP